MGVRLNAAVTVGGVLTVFGVAAVVASFQINPDPDGSAGARIFPLVGSVSILVLGVLELTNGLRGRSGPLEMGRKAGPVFALLLLSLLYVWLIGRFGYLIATGVTAAAALWMFGIRSPIGLVIAAVLCPAAYHLIFFELLGVFPPYGEWFDLLDVIRGE